MPANVLPSVAPALPAASSPHFLHPHPSPSSHDSHRLSPRSSPALPSSRAAHQPDQPESLEAMMKAFSVSVSEPVDSSHTQTTAADYAGGRNAHSRHPQSFTYERAEVPSQDNAQHAHADSLLARVDVQDELWRIFTHYCVHHSSTLFVDIMTCHQFVSLLKDCGLITQSSFALTHGHPCSPPSRVGAEDTGRARKPGSPLGAAAGAGAGIVSESPMLSRAEAEVLFHHAKGKHVPKMRRYVNESGKSKASTARITFDSFLSVLLKVAMKVYARTTR